uniref:Uncharacterized protein n=1 Tax=Cacopsylla melanoneura TaxID=428564 RepID=A0A8D8QIN3_9HEMI
MNEERPDNLVDNEDAILEVLCQESDDDEQQGQEEIEEQIDSEDEDCDDEDRDPNYDPSSESLEDNILKNIEKNFEESRKPPVKKRRKETTSSKSKNTNQDPIVNAPSEEIRGKDGFVWHSTARKGTTKVSSKNKNKNANYKAMSRSNFMLQLHKQLTIEWQKIRYDQNLRLSKELRAILKPIVGDDQEEPSTFSQKTTHKKTYCNLCHYKKKRHTTTLCSRCEMAICGEHQRKFCPTCTTYILESGQ